MQFLINYGLFIYFFLSRQKTKTQREEKKFGREKKRKKLVKKGNRKYRIGDVALPLWESIKFAKGNQNVLFIFQKYFYRILFDFFVSLLLCRLLLLSLHCYLRWGCGLFHVVINYVTKMCSTLAFKFCDGPEGYVPFSQQKLMYDSSLREVNSKKSIINH